MSLKLMGDWQDDQERLLGYIAAAAALLFTFVVVFILVVQTVGPAMGMTVGVVSDVALGTLVGAIITLTTSVAVREWLKRGRR